MGSLERRVESLEDARMRGKAQLVRQTLGQLSDAELEALEESLDAEAPPMNGFLQEIWEEIEESRRAKKGEMQ